MELNIGEAAAPADAVKDSDTARFAEDVIKASQEVPIIVDFWAPWCGPCKTLGPTIEKLVKQTSGKIKLVKINVDENQQLAAQLRVQSIPAVFAFKDGQPVDGFVGALPESQIKAFMQRLVGDEGPSPVDRAIEQAQSALSGGDVELATDIFNQVLRADAENRASLGGLVHCYVKLGDYVKAHEILNGVDDSIRSDPLIQSAEAALELAEQAEQAGDIGELSQLVAVDPSDYGARMELSKALLARDQREEAAEQLLEIITRDRTWNEEAARKQLLVLFDAWGATDELTLALRRRLSSILFS